MVKPEARGASVVKRRMTVRGKDAAPITLGQAVKVLRKHYGRPTPPPTADPFELVLWEKPACAYHKVTAHKEGARVPKHQDTRQF